MLRSALPGVALVALLFCGSARAAITLQDGGTNVIKTSANSITAPGFTVTAGASVLVVNVFTRDNQTADALPATLPWGSQTLTKIASVNNGNATWAWSEIYYLYNPAAITQDITISETPSSQAMTMQVFTLAGVDTAFPPVPYTAVNNNAQTLSVNLAGTAAGSWASVSSSYGTGNLNMFVTATSGTVICQAVQNSTSQCMGYVSNIVSAASTITATDNSGNQKLSLAVAVFPALGALPPTPTGLAAAPGDSHVTLTWKAVGNAGSYNVLRSTTSGTGYTTVGTPSAANFSDSTAVNGTLYFYVVQAVNGNGTSANSTEVSTTPEPIPTAPNNVVATAQTNRVALSWSDTSGGLATSYNVLRSITSGSGYLAIATLNGNASTSYIDHTVYDGTIYYYVVQAVGVSGASANSAQVSATPFFALPAGASTGVLLKDGGTNSITTTASGVSTISSSFSVSAGAHVLVVELWDNNTVNNGSSPSTMSWVVGSTTQSLVRAVSQSSTAADCNIYYVFNPTSGAGTISAEDSNGASVQGMSMMPFTLRGVDTTVAPVIYQNTSASATTVSVNLASVTPPTAWAAVLSSDSSTGQALTQTSTSGTSIYKSVNNNACLGYVQNLASGGTTIAMHGASGAVSLAVAVFMPAVATPIAILDGSVAMVADGGGSGTVTMPFSVSQGATVLAAALAQIDNSNPFPTNILWANTSLGVTQLVFAVASEWAGYGQIHPNVHALIDPLPGNGYLIATMPAGNSSSHLFLQAYTLVGVDTAIPTAVYGAGTESTLPGGVRTNYIAVNLAAGTPANAWAEVCTYDNSGNLSALMVIGCTNNGVGVGTVVYTNFSPNVLASAGYVLPPAGVSTISASHPVSGAADALGINVAVFSPLVLVTVPTAPINVVATPHTGQVALSWADSTATSYNVYRSTTSGTGYQLIATTIGGNATSFTDTYVVGGTNYYYVIQGVNIAGQSPYSAEVSATPGSAAIIGTGIGVVDGSVNNNITVGPVTNFSMPFSVSSGASVLVAATYDNNGNNSSEKGPALVWSNATFGTTQPLTAVVVGSPGADNQTWGTLYYLMAPVPGVGEVIATETIASQNTTFLQVYTLGGVDTNIVPTTAQTGSIGASVLSVDTDPSTLSFSWAAVLAADYDGGAGNDVFIMSTSGSVTTVNTRPNSLQFRAGYISNLDAGDTTITATKSGTTGTSMYLATEVFSPLTTLAAPTNVVATGQTNQIKLTWADGSGGGATSYVLLRSTISGHGYTPISTNGTASYTDTAVTDWVPYYYVVRAYGPSGVSIYSPEATAYAVGTPSAAKGLTAFGDINRVDLSWNSELGADSYTVLRSSTSGGETPLVSGLTGTNYTDSSVVDGTRYYYEVRVVNNTYGTGPNSAEASAIPVVTFFTNWFGIFSPGTNISAWTVINGSPNINLAENTVLGAPDFPSSGPSTDCLIMETNMGPNTTDDLQGMGNAFSPSINVRTYKSLELDIKNFGAYDRNNQIQAIQLNLQVPVAGVPTYERGTWGDIVLSSAGTGGSWTHYTAPLTNWAAFDLTQVTSVGINIFDSLYLASSDMAVGFANLEFSGAPGWASTISVSSRTITGGSTSALLLGKVNGMVDGTNLFLFVNTPISVTINGSTQTTVINDATGDFSLNFNTTGFANGSYPVTYTAATDMVALIGATNTSTSLTVGGPPPSRPIVQVPSLDGTGTNLVVKVPTQGGYLYYLLSTASLTPPVVWTTNSVTVGTGGTITELVPFNKSQHALFVKFLVQ